MRISDWSSDVCSSDLYGAEDRRETTSAHVDMAKRAEQNVTGAEILIVEDDPRVLSAPFDAVIELGHHPVACDHPSKAPSLLAEHERIGLIISAVLIPDMTVADSEVMLSLSHPTYPVLFVTLIA